MQWHGRKGSAEWQAFLEIPLRSGHGSMASWQTFHMCPEVHSTPPWPCAQEAACHRRAPQMTSSAWSQLMGSPSRRQESRSRVRMEDWPWAGSDLHPGSRPLPSGHPECLLPVPRTATPSPLRTPRASLHCLFLFIKHVLTLSASSTLLPLLPRASLVNSLQITRM